MRKTIISSIALGLLLFTGGAVTAQDKPVAVVSVASIEKLVADISQLAVIAEAGPQAQAMPAILTLQAGVMGIDVKKPIGFAVFLGNDGPKVMGFIPVTSFENFTAAAQAARLPLKDNGDGTWSISGPGGASAVIKAANGWMFISQGAEHLGNLPADPTALLGGLEKQFGVAARVNVAAVPAPVKAMALEAMKSGAANGMRRLPNEDDAQFAVRRSMVEGQIKQLETVINESDSVTIGWAVDATAKTTFLEVAMSAVAGSNLAKQIASNVDVKSDHGGFLIPGAAMKLNLASKIDANDQKSLGQMLEEVRTRLGKEIDNSTEIPNEGGKQAMKDIVGQLMDVVKNTVQSGKIDGGATLLLGDKSLTFAAGGYVADGKAVEASLRKLVELAKNEPDFPGMNFNVESHQGVSFHAMSIPVPDAKAQQVFGNKLDVVVGTGAKSAYLAIGKDAIPTLKQIIDKSATGAAPALPMQMSVSLTPVLKFLSSVEPNPIADLVSEAVAKANGKDQLKIYSKIESNASVGRFELEEGVLKAIGAGVKAVLQLQGGGGARPF